MHRSLAVRVSFEWMARLGRSKNLHKRAQRARKIGTRGSTVRHVDARAGTFSSSPRLLKSGTRREARCAVVFVCEPTTTRVCVQRTGYVWRALAAGEV